MLLFFSFAESMQNDKYLFELDSYKKDTLNYPDKIGLYTKDTIVIYHGQRYRCISNLELKFCNDQKYVPNGTLGSLVWYSFDDIKDIKEKPLEHKKIRSKMPEYPNYIGSYKEGQVVVANQKRFKCINNKNQQCNNIIYSPIGEKGYIAWKDITGDFYRVNNSSNDENIVSNVGYTYPNNISEHKAGTVVVMDNKLYKCRLGPESVFCSDNAYRPTGKYGSDAWIELRDNS
ncbi:MULTISPECIES: hypothetical protein [unclassified Francisella]|uniref:hypothetical protein n=1 Tax=unclassified Francisella TaxID=2610885 RepID=UPI002E356258|nr:MULTISPECIES: hypothetical protein [unclassified Francisella]MED7820353.1 hypothetical protein [Francisella sp. 19S2-4]MED7831183.1 hypothetical protein [Francisella sp. 19S2-10]